MFYIPGIDWKIVRRTELVINVNCRRAVKTIITVKKVNLTSIFNYEFKLELSNLHKIKNSRGVNRPITEGDFKNYICILYITKPCAVHFVRVLEIVSRGWKFGSGK